MTKPSGPVTRQAAKNGLSSSYSLSQGASPRETNSVNAKGTEPVTRRGAKNGSVNVLLFTQASGQASEGFIGTSGQCISSHDVAMRVGEEELESLNISELSAMEILRKTMMVNNDPVVERLLLALERKIPNKYSAFYEKEKRMRSIVIAGIEELEGNPRPSERLSHLEDRARDVLDALDVECKPCELYRMGSGLRIDRG
ncbi:unnamed protein product [Nippostrongylus brasiliensis]|uniref:RPOL4c domain-containing protein n=1 Tax=Nippostrongylus brasiliensis TaxID=27835 RepID=A0A0N4XSM3_NIPBR|nr:unnamed protein product [Nippostrongylus brasiliensis]